MTDQYAPDRTFSKPKTRDLVSPGLPLSLGPKLQIPGGGSTRQSTLICLAWVLYTHAFLRLLPGSKTGNRKTQTIPPNSDAFRTEVTDFRDMQSHSCYHTVGAHGGQQSKPWIPKQ